MVNIEILSEDKIITLKSNKKKVQEYMSSSTDNLWLKEFFKEENPFSKSKVYIPEILLKIEDNKEDNLKADIDNAILLHKSLRLTDSQACDERLWVSLCFGMFYNYMMSRWDINNPKSVSEHWFFAHGQKRSLYINGLSRLYWFAKITYDEKLEDPYEITKFCFRMDLNILYDLISRGYSNSKTVRLALLKSLKSFVENGGYYNRYLLREILKYVSFLGGAYILDSFTEEELYNKIYSKLIDLANKENPQQDKFKL